MNPKEKPASDEDRAYRTALGFIAAKARTIRETAAHLSRRGFTDEAVSEAVARLRKHRYLDDEAYARILVESRTRLNPRGVTALVGELVSKGVDERTAAEAASGVDEADAARRALEKGLYRWRDSDRAGFTRKAMAFLGRRGFSGEISIQACHEAWKAMTGNNETDVGR